MLAPLAALEPEPSNVTCSGAGPAAVVELTTALGGVAGVGSGSMTGAEATEMAIVDVLVRPWLSATVRVTV